MKWRSDDYILTDDKEAIDLEVVHDMLSRTYWAKDRPKEIIKATIEGSLCFALLCWKRGGRSGSQEFYQTLLSMRSYWM